MNFATCPRHRVRLTVTKVALWVQQNQGGGQEDDSQRKPTGPYQHAHGVPPREEWDQEFVESTRRASAVATIGRR